jgi:hypothetical protein
MATAWCLSPQGAAAGPPPDPGHDGGRCEGPWPCTRGGPDAVPAALVTVMRPTNEDSYQGTTVLGGGR